MEITRETVRISLFILGPLVLASYVIGISRMGDPTQLWGGIPDSWRTLNVTCMFIAAAGFLIMIWFFLYHWDSSAVESIQWPWGEGDEGGHMRLLISLLLVLIPSMCWLELTSYHISSGSTLSQWLVIGNLWLVCLGNVLLGLLAWGAHQQGIATDTIWPIVGAVMLALQVVGNDGIIWVIKYPW